MKKKNRILVIVIIIGIFSTLNLSCKKEEQEEPKPDLPEISVVDISQESDWDYFVGGKKDYYFVKSDNFKPTEVLFHSYKAQKNISIFFRSDGLPNKVVVDNFIFIFDNFNGNKVDIGIIYPNGDIEILRKVASDTDWDNFKGLKDTEAWSDLIRWTGRAVSGIPCALSVGATIATGGFGFPTILWTCGNFLLSLSSDILQEEFDIHNGFFDFVDTYGTVSTYYECAATLGLSCLTGLSSNALGDLADSLEELEDRPEDIQITEAALTAGYGDVQITLSWNNEADLDLHVFDPNNEEIYWDHPYSLSGGILDYDDIDGFGPENVYWPEGDAPDGTYNVYLHHYVWEDEPWRPKTSYYTVLVNAFDNVKKFTGTISQDELIHIADFNKNGIYIGNHKSIWNVSNSLNKK